MGKGNSGFCFRNVGVEMLMEYSIESWNMQREWSGKYGFGFMSIELKYTLRERRRWSSNWWGSH